jgi:hypothetical protein
MNNVPQLTKDQQIEQQGFQIDVLQGALETSQGIIQKLAQQLVAMKANVGSLTDLSDKERRVIAELTGLNVSDLFSVQDAQANLKNATPKPDAGAEKIDENLNAAASEFGRVLKKLDINNITPDVLRDGINETCQSLFKVSAEVLSNESKQEIQGLLYKMNDPVQFESLFVEILSVFNKSGVDLPRVSDELKLQKMAVKMVEREFNIEKRKQFSLGVRKITDMLQNSPEQLNIAEVKKQISDLATDIFLKYSKKDDIEVMEILERVINGQASNEEYVEVFQNAINIAKSGYDIEDMEDNLPQLNVGVDYIHYSYDVLAPLLESTANPTRTEIGKRTE